MFSRCYRQGWLSAAIAWLRQEPEFADERFGQDRRADAMEPSGQEMGLGSAGGGRVVVKGCVMLRTHVIGLRTSLEANKGATI